MVDIIFWNAIVRTLFGEIDGFCVPSNSAGCGVSGVERNKMRSGDEIVGDMIKRGRREESLCLKDGAVFRGLQYFCKR